MVPRKSESQIFSGDVAILIFAPSREVCVKAFWRAFRATRSDLPEMENISCVVSRCLRETSGAPDVLADPIMSTLRFPGLQFL